MINIRRLTATTHSQRCAMCDRWMPPKTLCQSVQYVCLSGMRHHECATDGSLECDCEVDE